MSLRAFHLFFILVSSALCAFLVIWGIYDFRLSGGALGPSLGAVGVAGLVLLTRYFRWFRQKVLKIWPLAVPALGMVLGSESVAQACAVCVGDPNSPLTKGALTGVAVLLSIVVVVLTLIVLVARSWIKRAHSLAQDF